MTMAVVASIMITFPRTCDAFQVGGIHQRTQQYQGLSVHKLYMSDGKDDAVARRRKRRGKDAGEVKVVKTSNEGKQQLSITPESYGDDEMDTVPTAAQDGTSSLEDIFGLGNNQLRELMEQELPVPREDLVTKKVVTEGNQDKNKVFKLPDLTELYKDDKAKEKDKDLSPRGEEIKRVDRSNREEYLRVLQLNPYADADDTMFLDEYDMFPAVFGSGKLLNIPVPYLQTGHGILLAVSLLAALVYAPGNPLTEFPPEIRTFLKEGLMVTYSINLVLAIRAFGIARSKNLPGIFWAVKSFLVGGVAFYECTQAKDPAKINEPDFVKPSDRKSQRNRKLSERE